MKIKSLVVIVKLDSDDCHQVMLTKSQEDLVLDLIEQLSYKSIKLNEDKLTTMNISYV